MMHLPRVPSSIELPISDGARVQAKGEDDRRYGTTLGQQGQDEQHQPERMLEAKQWRAGRLGEGRAAGMTFVAAFFDRVDATASACATGGVRAYYQLWTHRWKGGIDHTPNLAMRSVLSSRLHAILRCYLPL